MTNNLMNIACEYICAYFKEAALQEKTLVYVRYTFNKTGFFAKLSGLHYDVFWQRKRTGEKEQLMVIVELLFLALDIMDDIQDGDGHEHPWGEVDTAQNLNILTGLLMICFLEVSRLQMDETVKSGVLYMIQANVVKAINGQAADLQNCLETEEDYLNMVSMKSGSLIEIACLLGAGEVKPAIEQEMKVYAHYLGIVEQLRNDVYDLFQPEKKSDLYHKKKTLPVLFCLNSEQSKYEAVKRYYENGIKEPSTEEERAAVQSLLVEGDALSYCSVIEKLYLYKIRTSVTRMPISEKQKKQLMAGLFS
ncbi:polyprenyl synthetase family protein [Domibacillus sp. DTU_2020_1001157_1_SI_ALB_TIR_016]|uniref:polyprenyl synthetase family protein n=1 Tax=Domibacillus sp. DTU_2020_1001157_1_SI_ALB_TIR_016 TaxID=3077789 RepID=UPI0028E29C65|nr:polyprenyl synthetase family protein [Domibacillus sp. DTU_2020_1001157_1_SI_ALB_TIR_016]WNS80464.1 polyprenyl synthetase family protein [Domibacillus sp. DTU_2020_1001157_1_SI_ALB_TIR_016]